MRKSAKSYYKVGHVIYDRPGGAGNIVFKLLGDIKSDKIGQEAILFGNLLEASPFYRDYSSIVPINLVPKSRGVDFKFLFSLLRLIKRKKYNLIFLHDSTASLYGKIAGILNPGVKIVSVYHGARTSNILAGIVDFITGIALTSGIICVSESVKRNLPRPLRRKAKVIYSGIECEMLPEGRAVENGIPVIICICRLEPPKDPITLIKACKRLFDMGLDFKCKIAGDGTQYSEAEKYIYDNNLSNKVELLGWREDVKEILAQSDIFVLPSYSEGLPVSLLEAMAAGLPIVASNVGGIPEVVCQGVNGFLFEPGKEEALTDCLYLLLSKTGLRKEMGQHSKELVKKFSFDNFINSWTDYILKMFQ